jgi:integrase
VLVSTTWWIWTPRPIGALIGRPLAPGGKRSQWRSGYDDFGLIFAQANGRPYDPGRVTKTFTALSKAAELRPIRLHDLRHGAESLMLAAGIPVEAVPKRLGHSSIGITMDTYWHMLSA